MSSYEFQRWRHFFPWKAHYEKEATNSLKLGPDGKAPKTLQKKTLHKKR